MSVFFTAVSPLPSPVSDTIGAQYLFVIETDQKSQQENVYTQNAYLVKSDHEMS